MPGHKINRHAVLCGESPIILEGLLERLDARCMKSKLCDGSSFLQIVESIVIPWYLARSNIASCMMFYCANNEQDSRWRKAKLELRFQ